MITFIIPTIGRKTLANAVKSIEGQTNNNWKAIIIFDGIEPTFSTTNPKITILKNVKEGRDRNSAGNVRNYGMKRVDTEWLAFLDDDDVIASDYVEIFNKELVGHPSTDVLIFRMYNATNNTILPKLKTDNFYVNEVGISFAMKTSIFASGLKFTPSPIEDYLYLHKMREQKYSIMISPHIKYFVNSQSEVNKMRDQQGNRVIIKPDGSIESFANIRSDHFNWLMIFLLTFMILLVILIFIFTSYKSNVSKKYFRNIMKRIGL